MSISIITEPTVYLVGQQTIDDETLGRFLADHEVEHWETDTDVAGQKLVEIAGRLCYMSFAKPRPGGNKSYIDHILEVGHGSVLEHAVFNLIITGVSRSFTHELVRHRAGFGYSQFSQRYVDESDCEFVVPPMIETVAGQTINPDNFNEGQFSTRYDYMAFSEWLDSVKESRASYKRLTKILKAKIENRPNLCPKCEDGRINISNGWCPTCEDYTCPTIQTDNRKKAREAARSVLPNATETKIFVTGNARALRHFIEMRGNAVADAEIRNVALKVAKVLTVAAPNLFGDYVLEPLDDGSFNITTKNRKV